MKNGVKIILGTLVVMSTISGILYDQLRRVQEENAVLRKELLEARKDLMVISISVAETNVKVENIEKDVVKIELKIKE